MAKEVDDDSVIRQVVDRLQERFPDRERLALEAVVREEFQSLAGRPVRDYLSILTERAAKKRINRESSN